MKSSSLIKGTLIPSDVYLRFELPRLENTVKGILNNLSAARDQLANYLTNGITINSQGVKHKFSPAQIEKIIPDQISELKTVMTELDKTIKALGFEAKKPMQSAASVITEVTASQKGQGDIKTAVIHPLKKS